MPEITINQKQGVKKMTYKTEGEKQTYAVALVNRVHICFIQSFFNSPLSSLWP